MAEWAIDYTKAGRLHPDFKAPGCHLTLVPDLKTDAPVSELDERAQRLHDLQVQEAHEDFKAFLEYAFVDTDTRNPFEVQWFHEEWIDSFENQPWTMVIAPRSHGKTAVIVAYIIWKLGRNPNLRIKIAAETDKTARKRLSEIKTHIEKNQRVHEVFPNLKRGDKWDQGMIEVQRTLIDKEPSVEAVGVLTGSTGSRCDLLVADDVVGRRNSLTIPANRQKVCEAWEDDWLNIIDDKSQLIYICTLWHRDDNSHRMMKTGEYNVLFYAIPDDYGSMWPGRWPAKSLRRKRRAMSATAWARGYKNQPQDDSTKPIQEGWLQFVDLAELGLKKDELVWFVSYDLATRLKQSNDYFASVVFAVDKRARKVYVVDAWHARLRPAQQETMVHREFLRYEPWLIPMELVGQADLDMRVMERWPELEGVIKKINPSGQGSKYERMMNVSSMVEHGQVLFSKALDPDGKGFDHARGSLINELIDLPLGEHDDMADAFSQGLAEIRRYILDRWAGNDENKKKKIHIEVIDTGGIL